jgi:glycosyltransferase involved in cell wall biosynthesis
MRIAIVSAHYPPNFVSGGTLVPQRIAETLAARGHEVYVFAGEVEWEQPDRQIRVEIVQPRTGGSIEVTWITLAGRLGWHDRNNYDGPHVHAPFVDFLRRVRPDVVHLHSLQGLGGSLVALSAASGAATVLTMHDMWWWCARQFLVQKDMAPCSSVVDTGICPCEVDNPWLRRRNDELAGYLRSADLVLAPSTPMLDILAANGVDPHRLSLDENPSPETVRFGPRRPPADPGAPIRFAYAGGAHAIKGSQVTIKAAALLGDLPGWSLDLFGVQGTALGPHTTGRPPYASDQVSEVLRDYDVLVMASVAFESYSLLTREALAAGCVVITADSPGPGEVVKDGVNGLVFPRGDSTALAAAMRALITDRARLEQLRPDPAAVVLRTQDEQAIGLEQHYRRILQERPPAGSEPLPFDPPLQRVLIVSGITGAPLRYRGFLPAEALTELGIHVDVLMYRDARVPELAATADAVVFYRVPATTQVLAVIEQIKARSAVPVLFDIDDLVVDPDLAAELDPILLAAGADLGLYWEGVRRYRTTLEACDGYIGSTEFLCRRVGDLTHRPTYRFANGVGRELARAADAALRRPRSPGPLRIGYFSGTNTHNEDWAMIEPAVVRLLQSRPEVHLWLGGSLRTSDTLLPFTSRIRRLPMTPWFELPALLRDLDVNLAPLDPTRTFNEAKSAIKFLEAALVRTPTVASPTGPFREAIDDGRTGGGTGRLATTEDDWLAAMTVLVDDASIRSRLGAAAREHVLTTWSPARQGHRYREILLTARTLTRTVGHHSGTGSWPATTLDEPYEATSTDFYGPLEIRPDGSVTIGLAGRSRLVRYRAAATTMLREQGMVATLRRAAPIAARWGVRTLRTVARDRAARVTRKGRNPPR